MIISLTMKSKKQKVKETKKEKWDTKNEDGWKKYEKLTQNNTKLVECSDGSEDLDKVYARWMKEIKEILKKCFKKTRIKNRERANTSKEIRDLMTEKRELKKKLTEQIGRQEWKKQYDTKERIKNMNEKIANEIQNVNTEKAKRNLQLIEKAGGVKSNEFWKIKQR